MSEAKHTTGPCEVVEFDEAQILVVGPETGEPRDCVLATCEGASRRANAVLFAGAPALLEACEAVMDFSDRKMLVALLGNGRVSKLEAAIAGATQ